MVPLLYPKAVIGAIGASVFSPIANWLVHFIPAPANVQTALSILLVASAQFQITIETSFSS